MRTLLVALLTLMLVACSGSAVEDPQTTDDTMTPAPAPSEVITVLPDPTHSIGPEPTASGTDGRDPRVKVEDIPPDPELMASMECEPLSPETESRLEWLWGEPIVHGLQVEVGEGLTPGEVWWIVTYSSTSEEFGERSSILLTNHPGIPDERGTWLLLGAQVVNARGEWAHTWDGTRWDIERLTRGQSAVAKALECFGA